MVWVGELGRNTYVRMYTSYIRMYVYTYIWHTDIHIYTHIRIGDNSICPKRLCLYLFKSKNKNRKQVKESSGPQGSWLVCSWRTLFWRGEKNSWASAQRMKHCVRAFFCWGVARIIMCSVHFFFLFHREKKGGKKLFGETHTHAKGEREYARARERASERARERPG